MPPLSRTAKYGVLAALVSICALLGAALYLWPKLSTGSARPTTGARASADSEDSTAIARPREDGDPTKWTVGEQREYKAQFGTIAAVEPSQPGGGLTLNGSATLALTCLVSGAEQVVLHGEIAGLSVVVDSQSGKRRIDDHVASMARPFALTLRPNGEIQSLSLDPEVRGVSDGLLRVLVSALQFVEPASENDWGEWTTEESDNNGTYRARYKRTAPGRFAKTKLEYSYFESLAVVHPGQSASRVAVRSETNFERTSVGVLRTIQMTESLETPLGSNLLKSQANVTLELVTARVVALPHLDLHEMATTALFRARALSPSAKDKADRKKQLAAGASFDQLVAELAKIPALPENRDSRREVVRRMAALFDTDPKSTGAVTLEMRRNIAPENGQLVLAALSDAENPQAHLTIGEIAEDPAIDRGVRQSALTHLGQLSEPSSGTVASLERVARDDADPGLKATATLALGGTIRQGAPQGGGGAGDVIQKLIQAFHAAQTEQERSLYLDALGNTGSPLAFDAIKSGLADSRIGVRASAVKALRFMPAPEADQIIAHVLVNDPALPVRMNAVTGAYFRAISDAVEAAAATALKSEAEASLRAQIVGLLTKKLRETPRPRLREILELAAASDPDEAVRRAAEQALRPNPSP